MPTEFAKNYKAKHQHPLNRLSHSIGIPMILVSLPLFFFSWRWALLLFSIGWVFQFIGHAIEGNRPAFFGNPVYLLVGPLWLVRRAAELVGLRKQSSTESMTMQQSVPGSPPGVVDATGSHSTERSRLPGR